MIVEDVLIKRQAKKEFDPSFFDDDDYLDYRPSHGPCDDTCVQHAQRSGGVRGARRGGRVRPS